MTKKRILFIADWFNFDKDRAIELLRDCNNESYEWHFFNSTFKWRRRFGKLQRYIENINAVLHILLKRNDYFAVVSWQQIIGFMLCLLPQQLLKPRIIITTVLYSPSRNNNSFVRMLLLKNALKKADTLVYFSKEMERDVVTHYPNVEYKVKSTYMPIIDETYTGGSDAKEKIDIEWDKAVFTGGKSDRDFNTVIRAFSETDVPVIIVCSRKYPLLPAIYLSDNIMIMQDLAPALFYSYAKKAFCTVISLDNECSSCGQLLFSFCMREMKPIIASSCYGSRDYIDHGVTGYLVPVNDHIAIRNAYYELLENDDKCKTIVENAKKESAKMTFSNYLKKMEEIIHGFNEENSINIT